MYSIQVGSVCISFAMAVISVPRNIAHHDWDGDEGVYVRQEITITQHATSATVTGMSGDAREQGPHLVHVPDAAVGSVDALLTFLLAASTDAGLNKDMLLRASFITDYAWGKLLALDWGKLDYVPGAIVHFLLPHHHPAIALGRLKLDWPTIQILHRQVKP